MEISDAKIALLVLGYLKAEKCKKPYKEFLRSSRHLKDNISLEKNKFIVTRYLGLSLVEMLKEYCTLYDIVQARLEATNYFNEHHVNKSLVDQLLYLLNAVQSRSTTPWSPVPSSHTQDSNTSDVEATPAHSLPGNMRCGSEESYFQKTPRRKNPSSKLNKSEPVHTPEKEDVAEMLAQTLLENKELHEKLAQTINNVRNTPEVATRKSVEYSDSVGVSEELDATIKTVVRRTEEDPIFEEILDEIIGSSALDNVRMESQQFQNCLLENDTQRNKFRTPKSQNYETMEEQNNEAVRSIITASTSKLPSRTNIIPDTGRNNNEVILYDGSLDNYIKSSSSLPNNPLYINSNNLVMMPTALTTNTCNIQYENTKQFFVVNNTPLMNVPQIKTQSGSLSEQEIMAMPTVIVNDEIATKMTTGTSLPSGRVKEKKVKVLKPKITKKLDSELAEYITMFSANDQNEPTAIKTIHPKKPKPITLGVTIAEDKNNIFSNPRQDQVKKENGITEKKVEAKPKEITTKTPKALEPIQKTTPKSGSHVRNLDFSTPPKLTSSKKKLKCGGNSPSMKKQAAKTLFKSTDITATVDLTAVPDEPEKQMKKKSSSDSWDAELRALIANNEVTESTQTKCSTPKRKKKNPAPKKKKATIRDDLNKTDPDALLLEKALETPVKEEPKENNISDTSAKEATEKTTTKKTPKNKKNAKNNKESDKKLEKKESKKTPVTKEAPPSELPKETKNNTTKIDSKNEKSSTSLTEENSNKMIVSPSKFNANKRKFVQTNNPLNNDENKQDKLITPDMTHENLPYPIVSKRNITPMLETPVKFDIIPKTPGMTPFGTGFTPFAKVLEEQLHGIDINNVQTPCIPITPNFPPFTPGNLTSPYPNRPTDYSTSSSYYQPSDTEQNKSLELIMMEEGKKSQRLENFDKDLDENKVKILSDIVIEKPKITSEITNNQTEPPYSGNSPSVISEHLKMFNQGVIGKKNLNLVNRDNSCSSSSSSSKESSSSESDSEDTSAEWIDENKTNDTVICNKPAENNARYPLRNRSSNRMKANESQKQEKEINNILNNVEVKSTLVPPQNDIKENSREKLLQEMEEKRKRTINKFKSLETSSSSKTKTPSRDKNASKTTTKTPVQRKSVPRKNRRKSDSPRKAKINPKKCRKIESSESDHTDEDFNLQLSDGETDTTSRRSSIITRSSKADKVTPPKPEKVADTQSDLEAENLVKGLKQWGIHLMHNKSPKKPQELEKNSTTEPPSEEKQSNCDVEEETNASKEAVVDQNHITESNPNKNVISETVSEASLDTNKVDDINSVSVQNEDCAIVFDSKSFEMEDIWTLHDEKYKINKKFEDYDLTYLKKGMTAKVFVERLQMETDITISSSPFFTLLDIPPSGTVAKKSKKDMRKPKLIDNSNRRSKSIDKKEDIVKKDSSAVINDAKKLSDESSKEVTDVVEDELMNYAIVGSVREESTEDSSNTSPKGTRKRKGREDDGNPEKKSKKNCQDILKRIDVDRFLNELHGQH